MLDLEKISFDEEVLKAVGGNARKIIGFIVTAIQETGYSTRFFLTGGNAVTESFGNPNFREEEEATLKSWACRCMDVESFSWHR